MVGAKKSSSGCCLGFSLWSQMWSGRSPRSPYIFIGAVVLWSYSSWIYNYMYLLRNQCLSPLMLWGRISIMARCTTLCDKVTCDRSVVFSGSTNKTDRHNIAEILLKLALNTIKPNRILLRYGNIMFIETYSFQRRFNCVMCGNIDWREYSQKHSIVIIISWTKQKFLGVGRQVKTLFKEKKRLALCSQPFNHIHFWELFLIAMMKTNYYTQ